MADCITTIGKYLKGKVRNINIPDEALASICIDAGVTPETPYHKATVKQRDLALAWLYVWVAGSPTQTGSVKDADGDWEHSDGGERMSAAVLADYRRRANEIFDKYDLPTIGSNKWGFVGTGFRKIRRYP